jgi:hypothetical protein
MQVLGGRFLERAGTDVVSDSQPVAIEKSGNNRLGNFLVQVFPDSIILAQFLAVCRRSEMVAMGTSRPPRGPRLCRR